MALVNLNYDLVVNQVTVVSDKSGCAHCAARKKDVTLVIRNGRCLCWDCLNGAVLGYKVMIEFIPEEREFVFFQNDPSADYTVQAPEIKFQMKRCLYHKLTIVPSSYNGPAPNCTICQKNPKLKGQYCWHCLVAK